MRSVNNNNRLRLQIPPWATLQSSLHRLQISEPSAISKPDLHQLRKSTAKQLPRLRILSRHAVDWPNLVSCMMFVDANSLIGASVLRHRKVAHRFNAAGELVADAPSCKGGRQLSRFERAVSTSSTTSRDCIDDASSAQCLHAADI